MRCKGCLCKGSARRIHFNTQTLTYAVRNASAVFEAMHCSVEILGFSGIGNVMCPLAFLQGDSFLPNFNVILLHYA